MERRVLVLNIFQTLAHILSFIKLVQFTMAHMFQYQLLNKVHKVSTMHHALQELI